MAEENKVESASVEAPAAEGPSIGLADLQNAVKVIDYAAEQGAFKGWAVIEQVFAVRQKLNAFVVASSPKEEPKAEEQAAPAAPAKKTTKAKAAGGKAVATKAAPAKTVKKVK